MAVFRPSVITNQGEALLTKLAGTASQLSFTNIRTSNTAYTVAELKALTALSGVQQTVEVGLVEAVSESGEVFARINSTLDNLDVNTAYTLNTIGLYATDPDLGEILFQIMTASQADVMPDKSDHTAINLNMIVNIGANVTVTIIRDMTLAATRQDLEDSVGDISTKVVAAEQGIADIKQDYIPIDELPDYLGAVTTHNQDPNAHGDMRSDISAVEILAQQAIDIAKTRTKAVTFNNYQALITALNGYDNEELKIGDALLVLTQNVPDLWIAGVFGTSVAYTYVSDAALLEDFATNETLQMGFYRVAESDSESVDPSQYVPATRTINGIPLSSDIVLPPADMTTVFTDGGSSRVRTLSIPGIVSYNQLVGISLQVKSTLTSPTTSEITMNINGLGAKTIRFPVSSAGLAATTAPPHLRWDRLYTIEYDLYLDCFVVVSFVIPSATTSARGIVQLNDSLTDSTQTSAATANAVKKVNDKLLVAEADLVALRENVGSAAELIEESLGDLSIYGNQVFQSTTAVIDLSDDSLRKGNIFKLPELTASITISYINLELNNASGVQTRQKVFEIHIPQGATLRMVSWPSIQTWLVGTSAPAMTTNKTNVFIVQAVAVDKFIADLAYTY